MKRLPLCALCGTSIKNARNGRVTLMWEKLKSKPTIGWHSECADKDGLFKSHENGVTSPARLVTQVGARGKGRVT